jgi:hypothetical protein
MIASPEIASVTTPIGICLDPPGLVPMQAASLFGSVIRVQRLREPGNAELEMHFLAENQEGSKPQIPKDLIGALNGSRPMSDVRKRATLLENEHSGWLKRFYSY